MRRRQGGLVEAYRYLDKKHEPIFTQFTNMHVMQGGSAEIYLHGGHITGWRTPTGKVGQAVHSLAYIISETLIHCAYAMQDLMFLSKKAIFEPPKAIRRVFYRCWLDE